MAEQTDNLQDQEILEQTIRAAVKVVTKPILELIEKDPHQWSSRPCSTCQTISGLVGRPFGCYAYAKGLIR
jgi:hypothetical protein